MLKDIDKPYLQRWLSLLEGLPVSDHLKLQVYNALRSRYGESHRAYHTFEHIKACLYHLDKVVLGLKNATNIELALWFHDVIYDPKSTSNELDSAAYADKQLQILGLPQATINKIHHLILLTQHPAKPKSFDEKMLIDIDLSILGASSQTFATYEKNIRKEYAWVDAEIYQRERAKVLRSFLDQARIYQTEYFFKKREQLARRNIKRVLQDTPLTTQN